jgi:type I restriction enzyme M protein
MAHKDQFSISSEMQKNINNNVLLGLVFYKSLCDQQSEFVKSEELTEEDMSKDVVFNETVDYIQQSLGFYIEQDYLFSTWIALGSDFGVGNVIDALHGFHRYASHNGKVDCQLIETLQNNIAANHRQTTLQRSKVVSHIIWAIQAEQENGALDFEQLYKKLSQ